MLGLADRQRYALKMTLAIPIQTLLSPRTPKQRKSLSVVTIISNAPTGQFSNIVSTDSGISFDVCSLPNVRLRLSWEYELYDDLEPLHLSVTPCSMPTLLAAARILSNVLDLDFGFVHKQVLQGFISRTVPCDLDQAKKRLLSNKSFDLRPLSLQQLPSLIERFLAARDLSSKDVGSLQNNSRSEFANLAVNQLHELDSIKNVYFLFFPSLPYANTILIEHNSLTTILDLSGVPRMMA